MNVKNIALAIALGCGSILIASDTVVKSWSQASLAESEDKSINVKLNNVYRLRIWDRAKSGLAKTKVENDSIVLDTSACLKGGPIVYVNGLKAYPGKAVYVEVDLVADEDGKMIDFYFEGQYGKGYYYRKKILPLTSGKKTYRVEQYFPVDLKNIHLRMDFLKRGVYRIGMIKYGIREDVIKKIDSVTNYIPNGGAERGFYCVIPPARDRFAGIMPVHIDETTAYSGKRSFRLEGKKINTTACSSTVFLMC